MSGPAFTAADVRRVREAIGVGMMDARKACEVAYQRFDGDLLLGALWVHANALAINVRGGPEARARWNEDFAQAAAEAFRSKLGWRDIA